MTKWEICLGWLGRKKKEKCRCLKATNPSWPSLKAKVFFWARQTCNLGVEILQKQRQEKIMILRRKICNSWVYQLSVWALPLALCKPSSIWHWDTSVEWWVLIFPSLEHSQDGRGASVQGHGWCSHLTSQNCFLMRKTSLPSRLLSRSRLLNIKRW